MAFSYAIVGKELPILIQEKSDKKPAVWIILSRDYQDHFSVSNTGKFNTEHVYPILGSDGGFNREPLARYGKNIQKIEKIFSLDGSYCYRGVLLRGRFISEAMADLISVTAFDSKAAQYGINCDLDYNGKADLMAQLLGSGNVSKMGGFVLGASSTTANTVTVDIEVDLDETEETDTVEVEAAATV